MRVSLSFEVGDGDDAAHIAAEAASRAQGVAHAVGDVLPDGWRIVGTTYEGVRVIVSGAPNRYTRAMKEARTK